MVWYDGVEQMSYPEYTGAGWWIFGAPILDQVNRTASNVIVGAREDWLARQGGTPADRVDRAAAPGDVLRPQR